MFMHVCHALLQPELATAEQIVEGRDAIKSCDELRCFKVYDSGLAMRKAADEIVSQLDGIKDQVDGAIKCMEAGDAVLALDCDLKDFTTEMLKMYKEQCVSLRAVLTSMAASPLLVKAVGGRLGGGTPFKTFAVNILKIKKTV